MVILEQLPVSSDFASRFLVDGDVTARDLSFAILYLHQSAMLGKSGEVSVRDNGTRHALALSRRDRIEVEEARWRRLRDSTVDGMALPTVRFSQRPDGSEYPWRHTIDDSFAVIVDQALLEAWTGDEDDQVFIPLRLLQHAERRASIILMMRVLAWATGDFPKRAMVRRNTASITLRFGIAEWLEIFGAGYKTWNRRLVDDVLLPAAAEITELTDWQVSVSPRLAHTGRIRDIEITIIDPVEDPAEDDRSVALTGKAWATKPRKRRVATSVTAPANPVSVSKAAVDRAVPLSVIR